MSQPHKAIIHVAAYIHELEPTGELGKNMNPQEIKKSGIKNFVIQLGAGSSEECIEKAKEMLERIKSLQ